jgi:hypothetical protein
MGHPEFHHSGTEEEKKDTSSRSRNDRAGLQPGAG